MNVPAREEIKKSGIFFAGILGFVYNPWMLMLLMPWDWKKSLEKTQLAAFSSQLPQFLCGLSLNPQLFKEIILLDKINIPGMLNILRMLLVIEERQGKIKLLVTTPFPLQFLGHNIHIFLKLMCKDLVGIFFSGNLQLLG